MTAREELARELSITTNVPMEKIYMVLDKYEVEERETHLTLLNEERNEFLIQRFVISKTVKGCTERTLKYYNTQIRNVLNEMNKTVDEITTDDIRMYLAKRRYRDNVTATTVNNEIRVMSSFFQFAYEEEYIAKNPCLRVDKMKTEKKKKEAFKDIEIEQMRNELVSGMDKAIFEVLLSTGCRVSELVQMQWEELEGNAITVHGKGQKDRTVYLNARAMLALENYHNERQDNNPYIFPKGVGLLWKKRAGIPQSEMKKWYTRRNMVEEEGHITTGTIEQKIRSLGRKVNVKAHPHKFRRTCATLALRRGMSIEQVSKMLGHEQISTTQIYLDLSEEDLRIAHKKFVV